MTQAHAQTHLQGGGHSASSAELRLIRHPEYATPDEVRDKANDMTEEALQCRTIGHAWKPFTVSWDRKSRSYDQILRCGTCPTERHVVLSEYGAVVSNSYRYPEGYLISGLGRIAGDARNVLRVTSVNRLLGNKAPRRRRAI